MKVINVRIELGKVKGTAVSHIKGNLVDLESDLKGTTRKYYALKNYINLHVQLEISINAVQEIFKFKVMSDALKEELLIPVSATFTIMPND